MLLCRTNVIPGKEQPTEPAITCFKCVVAVHVRYTGAFGLPPGYAMGGRGVTFLVCRAFQRTCYY